MTIIDTHIHLQDNQYIGDLPQVLHRACLHDVSAVIVPGTNLVDSLSAVELADKYSNDRCGVYAAVGVHPTQAHTLDQASLNKLGKLAQHPRVVAIGEIGLDYYWPDAKNRKWHCADPATQRRALQRQLELASILSLPVIVHNRDADEDVFSILKQWHQASPTNRGVLHSYASGLSRLNDVYELEFNISISGPVTFRNAEELRQVARVVPDHILMIETDGPYLSPEPHRGKRNEPAYLNYIAKQIAEVRDMSISSLTSVTTRNSIDFFKLPMPQ